VKLKKAVKVLQVIFTLGFVFCLVVSILTQLGYSDYMPRSPQPETGRIYRVEVGNHGRSAIRYVSRKELDFVEFARKLFPGPAFLFFFGVALTASYLKYQE
jgi:hypothetical protein